MDFVDQQGKKGTEQTGKITSIFVFFLDFSSFSLKAWFTSCFSPFSLLHVISSFGSVNKRQIN
jgi:hypothetical protein